MRPCLKKQQNKTEKPQNKKNELRASLPSPGASVSAQLYSAAPSTAKQQRRLGGRNSLQKTDSKAGLLKSVFQMSETLAKAFMYQKVTRMNVTIHSALTLTTDCPHCHLPHRHRIRNKIDCGHNWFCCIRAMQRGGEVLSVVLGLQESEDNRGLVLSSELVLTTASYRMT